MTHRTDELVMEAIRRGDTASLGILYERYKTVLFNYFLRVSDDRDLSNDLLMETFERVFKYRGSYKVERKVRPWIFQIASNLMKDSFKQTNRVVAIHLSNETMEAIDSGPPTDKSNRAKLVREAMDRLKPRERNIVQMYYLLEMSYDEIAFTEGISVNNVRIIVCRSLKKLNRLLKNSGI